MKTNVRTTAIALGALATMMVFAGGASAQNVVPAQASPVPVQTSPMPAQASPVPVQTSPVPPSTTFSRYPVGAERAELVTPNPVLLGGAALGLVGAYVPGLIIAATSDHDGDKWLYAPVIGPWFDLATRGCNDSSSGPNCGVTGFERAALIGSGVVQGLAVITMLGSLTMPQRRLTVTHATRLHFAPAVFASRGQGIVAFAAF